MKDALGLLLILVILAGWLVLVWVVAHQERPEASRAIFYRAPWEETKAYRVRHEGDDLAMKATLLW